MACEGIAYHFVAHIVGKNALLAKTFGGKEGIASGYRPRNDRFANVIASGFVRSNLMACEEIAYHFVAHVVGKNALLAKTLGGKEGIASLRQPFDFAQGSAQGRRREEHRIAKTPLF